MKKNKPHRLPKPVPASDETALEMGDHDSPAPEGSLFPIVGVGASAGGLEAFTELLRHLPLDTGMGFVLVQHLDPVHESALTQILTRATSMPVSEVTNDLRVEANCVYIIPPNSNLSISLGVLKLQPRQKSRTATRSIDYFFEALAQDQRERAVGVILSGTATDGTLGLEMIKAEGGITFAQDDSAKYDSMPRSAAAAGCVDFVLSPEKIANELARIAKHPYVTGEAGAVASPEDDRAEATEHAEDDTPLPSGGHGSPPTGAKRARAEAERAGRDTTGGATNGFKKVVLLLRNHSGVDFSLYKSTTIQRRITRRLVLNKQGTLEDYAALLRGNTKELDALYSDVLISVTSFFRNPEAFEVLKHTVFPKLLQQRRDDPLRVWVLGCSTGQEAYSIAMGFVEATEKASRLHKLQVFATDLNEALLDKARHGLYARNLEQDLSPERLRRFFTEEDGGYRVNKALREMVVFARQNLISDPPFSRMDLISCRNLLIYLEPSLQKKALPTFHYALKPGGFLLLGASESIGNFTELFEPVDKKQKVYSKKAAPTSSLHLPVRKDRSGPTVSFQGPRAALPNGHADAAEGLQGELTAQREADRVAVNQFAPPGVLINAELQILQFRGPTGAYLEPPTGKASFDVLKMAREGLMLPLRAAINQAKKANKTARRENVRVTQNGQTRSVNLEVIPLKNLRERCFLIVFEDPERAARAAAAKTSQEQNQDVSRPLSPRRKEESRRNAELEADLAETRDYLQSIQEQSEAANEELQASSEEVQSANEELQSINEELETSKEELESANEELITINEEMSNRNSELNRLNSDLVNFQSSTKLAIVLLGRDLTIRRFSAQAEKQFDLKAGDIGRPFGNVRHKLVFAPQGDDSTPDLDGFIAEVIATVHERECEVQDQADRWYSLRVRPYMTLDNRVDGAVLVLVDINDLKRTEQAIAAARDYAAAIVQTSRDPLVILDTEMRVHSASEAFYSTFKISKAEVEGRSLYELDDHQWDIPRLRRLLEDVLPRNSFFDNIEVTHDFKSLGRRTMLLNARTLAATPGQPARVLLGIEDVTEQLQFQATVRRSEIRYRRLFEAARDGVLIIDPETRKILDANPFMTELLGYTRQEFLGKELFEIGLLRDEAASRAAFRELKKKGVIRYEDLPLETKSGERRAVEFVSNLYEEEDEKVIQCNIRDITERKRAEKALREAETHFRNLADNIPQLAWIADAGTNGHISWFNRTWFEYTGTTLEQMQGTGWHAVHHPDHAARVIRKFTRHVKEGLDWEDTFPLRRKDGEFRWFLSRMKVIRDESGGVVQIFGTNTDVSEQRQMADMLQQNAADMLQSDRRKNEFLALLAHELRNPLAPVRNAVQVLKLSGGDSATVDLTTDLMERQIGQMVRLVDDLLDVSRISRNKIELRKGWIELASVVHHAVDAALTLVQGMNHDLMVSVTPQPIYLHADPTRLAQVVGNLLSNACKFTGNGGRIWLTLEQEDKQAVIRVRDSGIGIAADQIPRVFEMFMQVDTSLERSVSGLGIGLSLVKSLVELHDGTVEAHSAGIGQGSEFVVRLPFLLERPEPTPQNITTEPTQTLARRILVVDDNRDSAMTLSMLLNLGGNDTKTASDGLQAVEMAETFRPDIVLLDIGLPKMNGYEACRKIREQPWGQAMTLIALTGWGQMEDRRKSEEAGFNGHVVKPVDYATLMKLLAESRPQLAEVDQ